MEKSEIWKTRIAKEKELLEKVKNPKFSAEFLDNDESLLLNFDVNGYSVSFLLEFTSRYPFDPPELKLVSSYGLESLTDISQSDSALELVLGESWLPVKSLNDVIESLNLYVVQAYKPLEKSLILDLFTIKANYKLPLLILLILILRVLVINMPQMDWNTRPDFGPYEKARNSMSVTFNYNIDKWYFSEGYQEIKDPPLFSYFSAGSSFICQFFDVESLSEVAVPGYESVGLKVFMRISVIFWELLILFPTVLHFFRYFYRNLSEKVQIVACGVVLVSPGIILSQHIFFSYCGVSSGLLIWAALLVFKERLQLACLVLALALGFSMDSLLMVLVLFIIIIVQTFINSIKKTKEMNQFKILIFFTEFVLETLTCTLSFLAPLVILSIPWLRNSSIEQLFRLDSITTTKSPTFYSLLISQINMPETLLQILGFILLQIPLLFLFPKLGSFQKKSFLTMLNTSFALLLFLQTPSLSLNFHLNLLFSLYSIISAPEIFRLFSIISCFTLYTQSANDNSRFGYFLLTTTFFLLTQHYIQTINYLQNRSSNSFLNYIYIFLLLVHISELFSPELFHTLHEFTSSTLLIASFTWLQYSTHSKSSPTSYFYTEKRFRNKNKNT